MFNIAEYRKSPDRLSDLLPWAALIREGVILNKDGSFQRSLYFRGPDLESSTDEQLVAATARLNNALRRLGSGWAIFVEARRLAALAYPQEGAFPDPVSWLIDAERRDAFEREGEHYESQYYLTFQYLPPRESVAKLSNVFIVSEQKKDEHNYERELDYFSTTVERLFDILKDFMFQAHLLDDAETLTYLHSCISDKAHPVSVPDVPVYLDAVLADSPLMGGLEPRLGKNNLRTLSIFGFPSTSVPAILDQLNGLPMEYRWVTRYLPLDKTEAEKLLKVYKRKWFAKRKGMLQLVSETMSKTESAMVDNAAMRKSQDADEALQELADDYVSFGFYTATVSVWDEDTARVNTKLREVERVINGLGFVTMYETINAVEAWLSSLPGQVNANVRMPLIHSLNLSHLIPFSSVWAGPERNEHFKAPALMYAKTRGNTPFRFSNHVHDVGHEMLIGPTGSGKSVLLNMMALQFLRYPKAQVFIFDKGGSFLATTVGVNGQYYDIGSREKTGLVFQPLAKIDNMEERVFASEWVLYLLVNEKIPLTPEVKQTIWDALTNLANAPASQRTLTGLRAIVQDAKIRLALEPYVVGGPYGDILDSDHEVFDQHYFQCFEMEALMQVPEIVPPVLNYIFHVLEKRFDGKPTLLILDEAWLFLDHPLFVVKIREWLKTLRKLNVSVIFATQSVDDTLNSPIASALIESCPSRIFLPNDRALEPNIYEKYEELGLNEKQIRIIANALPRREYYFESNQGNALFDLDLTPLSLAFAGVSRPEEKQAIRELMAKYKGFEFAVHYLQSLGLTWAVDIIKRRIVHV